MLLGYIDESYDDAECWLTALLVRDPDHADLTKRLRQIAADVIRDHGLDSEVEFHGYDVFHGEHGWAPLKATPRLRIGIYKAVLAAVAEADCKVIHSGAVREATAKEWPDHHPTEHAHRVAFFGLLQEVASHSEREGDRALLIADEVSRTSGELLRQDVRWLQERNERVIDTVHFIRSHESPLVQAADMVGYIHRRVRAIHESDPRAEAANQTLARIVQPLVVARRRWPDQPLR